MAEWLYCAVIGDRIKFGISKQPMERVRSLGGTMIGTRPGNRFAEAMLHTLLDEHGTNEVYYRTPRVMRIVRMFESSHWPDTTPVQSWDTQVLVRF